MREITYRQALNEALDEEMTRNDKVFIFGEDVAIYGGAYGVGVDMQLFPNMFLRAEYQGVTFASGGKRPDVSISTARVGGGIKF